MDPLSAAFQQVWSAATVVAAIISGLGFGWVIVGRVAGAVAYVSMRLTAGNLALIATALSLAAGVAFYVGQSWAAYYDGDTGWPRIVSRYGIWVIFGLTTGAGTYARVKWHIHRKHRSAHLEATARVETQERH